MRIRQNYIHTADDLRARTRAREAEAKLTTEERAQRAAQAAEQKAREDSQAAAAAAQQAAQAAAQQEARAAAAVERERIEFERREYHRLSNLRAAQEAQEALKTFKATHVVSLALCNDSMSFSNAGSGSALFADKALRRATC